ncbi:ATPase BadF/BadG/BcrA/BcrD type [Coriobacterium glomerans PW2]|uniref:ATPase BadF/BadG/BcrA/BcrD type n=1 Tax=Coriobacterium glomerans (strain ATCC 49209 / DSM 20642 / JCM 10262 / PW2) TaxID=700015 RepID=F2N7U8_CORGP|nr:BadF/BadG/BcrA/BcrD ATPase family protein [Coriobacterium glomerans]AEB07057.1 ATPase BadF/BadG/BcrA/BcrD type [Coriobacterium glomerans PW2]
MWLGVDGGGTKTTFALYDDDMRPLDAFDRGTSHIGQIGAEAMRSMLVEGFCEAGLRGLADVRGIGFGIAGFGEGASDDARIRAIVTDAAAGLPFELVNDVQAALAASLDLAEGIVIVAGTGSIAYGERGGVGMRCGGWDYQIGDEGSGYWMGKQLVRAFSLQSDGRRPRGALHRIVRQELELSRDLDLIAYMRDVIGHDRTRTAALSVLVSRAAMEGDPDARDIFRRAAAEEARMVEVIADALFGEKHPAGEAIPVSYVGGTFKAGELILNPLAEQLPSRCRLVAPIREAASGACLLLRRRLSRCG